MFQPIEQGFVYRSEAGTSAAVAAGSRAVPGRGGDLVCTFMVQSALGINDFVPLLSRSEDSGASWGTARPMWPQLASKLSLFGSISRSTSGELFFYGIATPIDTPGESFWSDETQGLKQNSLFWAVSLDEGRTWTDPAMIPLGYAGSAEAPGPLCVTREGAWLGCYAPYNTFDPSVKVERDRLLLVRSEDRGRSWQSQVMTRFEDPASGGAEAWVVELAGGALLGTCWNIPHGGGPDLPNAYTVSCDGGRTWSTARSTGILGQSTGLLALPEGRALMAYNQRKHGQPGVWIATASPSAGGFGLESNEIVWHAAVTTQGSSSGEHNEWTDFAFGEPSLTLLPDGIVQLTFWCAQPEGHGIQFVKLRRG